jgi:hypothetical protein
MSASSAAAFTVPAADSATVSGGFFTAGGRSACKRLKKKKNRD